MCAILLQNSNWRNGEIEEEEEEEETTKKERKKVKTANEIEKKNNIN